jgi:hypothetical protein
MAALSWNGLNGITPTAGGLLLNPNRGVGFVVQTNHPKEFALMHWLVRMHHRLGFGAPINPVVA